MALRPLDDARHEKGPGHVGALGHDDEDGPGPGRGPRRRQGARQGHRDGGPFRRTGVPVPLLEEKEGRDEEAEGVPAGLRGGREGSLV